MRSLILVLLGGMAIAQCGSQGTTCADQTANIYQLQNPLPTWGDPLHAPSGTATTVNDLGTPVTIYSLTNDDNSCGGPGSWGIVATSLASGENHVSRDKNFIWLGASGGGQCVYQFNAATMSLGTNLGHLSTATGTCMFSRLMTATLYCSQRTGTQILALELPNMTPRVVFDFAPCLPVGYTVTWSSTLNVSADDSTIAVGYAHTGEGENTGHDLMMLQGHQCLHYDTSTGTVTSQFGPSGQVMGLPNDRYTIHNVAMSQDGRFASISWETCLSATCTPPANYDNYLFDPADLNLTYTCDDRLHQQCSGHGVIGYTHQTNADGGTRFQEHSRVVDDFSPHAGIALKYGGFANACNWLTHPGWVNDDSNDLTPFYESTYNSDRADGTPAHPFTCPFENEIDFVDVHGSGQGNSGGTIYRQTHTYSSGRSGNPSCDEAIPACTADGKLCFWTSDGMGAFGGKCRVLGIKVK